MNTIPISKFKATCLAVLDKVNRTGQPIIVTKRGKPIAKIDPAPPPEKKASWLGSFQTKGKICGDIVSPVMAESDWGVLDE
ncbi:MAG: type II toxin-antitoxin system Phd/YefM family antitoxin [Desulfobacterales bacterium]|nr:type II toxin-antitoxin system Phd/YefM family antitoxin [Desulfobacterales bacterium]